MLKKIKKLICIVAMIAALISTQTYALMQTMYDPAYYFVGAYDMQDNSGRWRWYVTPYYSGTDDMDMNVNFTGFNECFGIFCSKIQPNTYYSFTVPITFTGAQPQLESGDLLPSVNQWFNVIPAKELSSVSPSQTPGQLQQFYTEPISLLSDDFYKMYYDANQQTLSVVFYLPESYTDEHPELLTHTYLVLSLGQTMMINNIPVSIVYGQTDVTSTGTYTKLLNDIVAKLDEIQSQGNGLTESELRRAIQTALENSLLREEQLAYQKADNAVQGGQQEIESVANEILNSGVIGAGAQVSSIFDLSQRAILTVPTIKIPAIGDIVPEMVLFQSQDYDITEMLDSMIPETIINLVRVINTILLLTYICKEVFGIFNRFTNGGENVV